MKKVVGVIPARLDSVRLAKKMIRPVLGKPLVQWTYESAARAAVLDEVVVACDSAEVLSAVESFGGKAMMTGKEHLSGTSRVCEIAAQIEAEVYINIQGDEPLMDSGAIDSLGRAMLAAPSIDAGTLAIARSDEAEFRNPNVVKVVRDRNEMALYFSRAPIPFDRDGVFKGFLKHLGIYAYRREFLLNRWPKLPASMLEDTERLEQLRLLEDGCRMKVLLCDTDSRGVDTEADLEQVEEILKGNA